MKRSEAVKIMTDKINESQYQDYEVSEGQVSEALNLLEDRIRITHPVPFGVWAHLDKNDPEYGIRTVYIAGWESEDEKK